MEIQRNEEILKIATKVFSKKDYHKVTMDEIADEAGVGKGTLYRYYKSKDDLYFSIINKGLETLYEYILRQIIKDETFPSKIKKVIFCTLKFFDRNKPFVKVFLQEEVKFNTKAYMKCQENLNKTINLIENLLREGQREGYIKKVNVSLAAILLIGMMKSTFLKSIEEPIKESLEEISELIFSTFFSGIKSIKEEKNERSSNC